MQHTNGENLRSAGKMVIDCLADYLADSQAGIDKVVDLRPLAELSTKLDLPRYIRQGGMDEQQLKAFLDTYLRFSMHMHHPAYIGHQVAVPHLGSSLGDLIHGVINNPMSIYEMGPSAAAVEYEMIQWMLEKIGWQNTGAGIFTHGGSISNIHAMLAARAAIAPDAWTRGNPADLVVLAPENAHYSIARAISIIGLGSAIIIPIPTNQHEVVKPDDLSRLIPEVRQSGKRIMAVIANACATATGLYDPVAEMGHLCQEESCWFHVDSPHGATALLSPKYKHHLKGLELADSMNWDAHKMMQTSTLSTAVLFRNKQHLYRTFTQKGSYLFYEKENVGVDSLPFQIECTKAGIATKLFLVLASMGERGMGEFIETLYDHAAHFARIISNRPGFQIDHPVDSNIICFRYKPDQFDQLQLREALTRQGDFYITSTEIKGSRYLRLVLMNTQTDGTILLRLLDEVEKVAQSIDRSSASPE